MSVRTTIPEHRTTGAVFTRPEVVSYMMREAMRAGGFRRWGNLRVLEPSCGDGAFVLPIVDALIAENPDWNDGSLHGFLRAFDVSEESISCVKRMTASKLEAAGCPADVAKRLISRWFLCEDFLLHDFHEKFDVVIGNPPYIRFDNIALAKQLAYKARYATFSERCDIYSVLRALAFPAFAERRVLVHLHEQICAKQLRKAPAENDQREFPCGALSQHGTYPAFRDRGFGLSRDICH